MLKKFVLSVLICVFSSCVFAGPLWHCIANNTAGAVWNQYGKTEIDARATVDRECSPYNDNKGCAIVCFPPRTYYRCLSHDTVPVVKDLKPGQTQPKQGTWFWASFSKQVAINGARDACRHNSAFGGCYVNPQSCASS